eukprot:NODE_251_length_3282_cov_9.000634.p2 GENE.NODE_251_length_3282_cov_9.000634~~NODE_251_length_3282_cov_9.000634.p2  ORF type:complete len:406 (-),score=58.36 NODE_251_length_3282_cov_9.000634:207-1424(-)
MVTFSTLVSSITHATTRLRNLNVEQINQRHLLRKYLMENNVHAKVTVEALASLKQHQNHMKGRLHGKDVTALQVLPHSIQGKIKFLVQVPIISQHPLFEHLVENFSQDVVRVVQDAIDEITLHLGQKVFDVQEQTETLYFVIAGSVKYEMTERSSFEFGTAQGQRQWLAEPALWLDEWEHTGRAVAGASTELLMLRAPDLAKVMKDHHTIMSYVLAFICACQCNPCSVTDADPDRSTVQEIVAKTTGVYPNTYSVSSYRPSVASLFSFPDISKYKSPSFRANADSDVMTLNENKPPSENGDTGNSNKDGPEANLSMECPTRPRTSNHEEDRDKNSCCSSNSSSGGGSSTPQGLSNYEVKDRICSTGAPDDIRLARVHAWRKNACSLGMERPRPPPLDDFDPIVVV